MKRDRDAGDDVSACSSRYQRSRDRRSVPVLLPQTACPDLQAATCQLQSGPDSATCLPRSAPPAAVGTDSRYEHRWKPAAAGMSSDTLLWQAHLKAKSLSTRLITRWCEAPCALVSTNHSQANILGLLIRTTFRGTPANRSGGMSRRWSVCMGCRLLIHIAGLRTPTPLKRKLVSCQKAVVLMVQKSLLNICTTQCSKPHAEVLQARCEAFDVMCPLHIHEGFILPAQLLPPKTTLLMTSWSPARPGKALKTS